MWRWIPITGGLARTRGCLSGLSERRDGLDFGLNHTQKIYYTKRR
jgi:hypothetical protein